MTTVGLKTLKNKLSEYIRRAAAGETVVVTDRNRVVAEIVPPRQHEHESFIERGVREGWLTPAVRGPDWPPPRRPIPGLTLEQLMTELDCDREDRC
jgi:prevent-host-death family protein